MEPSEPKPAEHKPAEVAKPAPQEVAASGATPAPAGVVPAGMMRMDLHAHSEASSDCRTPLEAFPARLRARGIAVQAVTDHNEIWGAQQLQAMTAGSDLTVIVGEEVSSRDGEIIGLYLSERIPPGLSAAETVERIKGQGGLVLVPHGFDPLKRWRLRPEALAALADKVDIVETFNARISRPSYNRAALEWADRRSLPKSAGSDAHTLAQLGEAWVQTPQRPVSGPEDLLAALRQGTVMGEWTHPFLAYAHKMWDFAVRRLRPGAR